MAERVKTKRREKVSKKYDLRKSLASYITTWHRACRSKMIRLQPCKIQFTQPSISKTFNGKHGNVKQVAQDIINGNLIKFLPPRVVIGPKGDYYCLDNRRLCVCKICHSAGKLDQMDVEIVQESSLNEKERERYKESLKRRSTWSIRFRNDDEDTMEHSVCNCPNPKPSNKRRKSKKSNKPQLRTYTQRTENEIVA